MPSAPVRDLLSVIHRLTPRDEQLLMWLHHHQLLTGNQILRALFGSQRAAQLRLATLRNLGFVTRVARYLGGPAARVGWTLGLNGARYTHAVLGLAPPRPAVLAHRNAAIAASPRLSHQIGVNEFFIRLHTYARHHAGHELNQWWSEQQAAAGFPDVHPDAYGQWTADEHRVGFFLEFETGSQHPPALIARLDDYRSAAEAGTRRPILIWVPTAGHEQAVHQTLAPHVGDLLVATGLHTDEPAEARLLPIGSPPGRRLRLADLPPLSAAEPH
ncbi:replication-relaxation family protein [Hamadaea sp. NPDC050747]|uniref:replication-relaxation family protein n=1 Tax=Hamadaea sp. NPDC050747 TaxID=3155789 RepID=UPI0033C08602